MERCLHALEQFNRTVNHLVWGPSMVAFIMLVGIFFSIGTGFFQITRMRHWLGCTLLAIFKNKRIHDKSDPHAISQFQALSTALAGSIGTGNIVGVATVIMEGGPGAVFWMWVSALFGMMTKYAENVLGNHYRYKNQRGEWIGGPMVYIERGLGCKWLAVLFAVFCVIASFGIGNMTQSNSIAGALDSALGIAPAATAVAVLTCSGLVILGGLKRIASVTEKFVPFMAAFYTAGVLAAIWVNRAHLPAVFVEIVQDAFGIEAAGYGIGGYAMMNALRTGVARGIFSNEAGLGSSVIVSSASNVKEPVQQGMWGIFEVFFDTTVMCTLTALCILTSRAHLTGTQGAAMSIIAFSSGFGKLGSLFVAIAIALFAFSTILGWSYYGERAIEYLSKGRFSGIYKLLYILMSGVGCIASLDLVWGISDTFNGLMAIPNLIALLFLSGKVFSLTRSYLQKTV